jgi:hypothetical protein
MITWLRSNWAVAVAGAIALLITLAAIVWLPDPRAWDLLKMLGGSAGQVLLGAGSGKTP